ncbi:hypothetical protein ACFQMM_11570 [Saliphagus sp. GCM10025308]
MAPPLRESIQRRDWDTLHHGCGGTYPSLLPIRHPQSHAVDLYRERVDRGNITLITLVVAINQVILSQELESPGSLRDEIDQSADYRQAALDQPAPPTDPVDFLQQLLQQTQEHAGSLAEFLPDSTSEPDTHLIDELPEECAQISEQLGTGTDKLSSVIVPLLGIEYATHIHECHQLESAYEGVSMKNCSPRSML